MAIHNLKHDNLIQISLETGLSPEVISQRVSNGQIVLIKNNLRNISPLALGLGCPTRVNANLGATPPYKNPQNPATPELEKLRVAIDSKTDAIMDLSLGPAQEKIRHELLRNCPVPLGTVPWYSLVSKNSHLGKNFSSLNTQLILNEIEAQAKEGVDFMTIHSGINQDSFGFWKRSSRIMPVVSRGGSLICKYMEETGRENPFFEAFDEILFILKTHGVTLSLGDAFRPGCGADAGDRAQIAELLVISELTERALTAGVKVIVEGPGHTPLTDIAANVALMKRLCFGVPYYVLGPLPTDSTPGWDHITAAIGGAQAAAAGADFLCYVTPAEHLCLPDYQDVRQGIMASRVAARCADNTKDAGKRRELDLQMSQARKNFDWESQFQLALDEPECRRRAEIKENQEGCSMCGDFCAMTDHCP